MTPELQKERAMQFVRCLDGKSPDAMAELLSDDFEFEMMAREQGSTVIRGRQAFVDTAAAFGRQMFPNGIAFSFVTSLAEGPQVALQAESETVAFNGKRYSNRYHYYFRFSGDKIAQAREYSDTDYVRKVLLS